MRGFKIVAFIVKILKGPMFIKFGEIFKARLHIQQKMSDFSMRYYFNFEFLREGNEDARKIHLKIIQF
jgi:hypothetical protein